jgi:chemotaxis protein histidine kinase CheA
MRPPSTVASTPPSATPAPKAEKDPELEKIREMLAAQLTVATKKDGVKNEEIETLKKALEVVRADAEKTKKAWEAEKAREAAEKAAAELRAAQEKKKKEEIADASKKAKEEAEAKAKEAAEKTKAEADKKLEEVTKAKEESEKKKKELEETIKKNAPAPDATKAPIRFKDAVGRKFSFPWARCKTWKDMQALIDQAFQQMDDVSEHVRAGHYDLTGPDGEIILPQVWDTMVQPDWEVNMHLWPLPEDPKKKKEEKPKEVWPGFNMGPMHPGMPGPGHPGGPSAYDQLLANVALEKHAAAQAAAKKGKKTTSGKSEKRKTSSPTNVIDVPAFGSGLSMAGMPGMPVPPPQHPSPPFPGGFPDPMNGLGGDMAFYNGYLGLPEEKKKSSSGKSSKGKSKSKSPGGLAGFFLGPPAKSSSSKKK